MAPNTGVCAPWSTVAQMVDQDVCSDADPEDPKLQRMLGVASEVLFHLSGKKYSGVCDKSIRPVKASNPDWYSSRWHGEPWHWSFDAEHNGYPWMCGGCGACAGILLDAYPVVDVTGVWVDGVELSASDYTVYDWQYLVRTDGNAWPYCQDLTKDKLQPGTFQVDLSWGVAPPDSGVFAAQVLACELFKAACGRECNLPRRVTSILRQGVQMTILDPQDFIDKGRTGIYEVDLFLKSINPGSRRNRTVIMSPDSGFDRKETL